MTSCREQVVAAVADRLAAIGAIAGLTVERDRIAPLTDADLPRLVLYEGGEAPVETFTGEDAFELTIEVEGYAGGASMAAANAAAARLRGEADRALLADRTLGRLARDLQPGPEEPPQRLELETAAPAKGFVRAYTIAYATAEGDPFTSA